MRFQLFGVNILRPTNLENKNSHKYSIGLILFGVTYMNLDMIINFICIELAEATKINANFKL